MFTELPQGDLEQMLAVVGTGLQIGIVCN